jgi:mannose-6-phosphate isomerase-like protein (cupin superfamily)
LRSGGPITINALPQGFEQPRISRMTIVRPGSQPWRQGSRPNWARTPSAGYFSLSREGDVHDRHYHDLNEFYLIARGKAKVLNGETEHYVQQGDIVCIRAGDEHDILEVYGEEDLQLFYFYEWGSSDARLGHLHSSPDAAAYHPVPRLPLPADFPPPAWADPVPRRVATGRF